MDCNPEVALKRIKDGKLRKVSDKKEYVKTSELQRKIRGGDKNLHSGKLEMATRWERGAMMGVSLNET